MDGSYVKTLFVSDYLSYGGFNIPTTCQTWSGKANWEKVDMEELDAATGATPGIGDRSFEFVCPEKEIPPGIYRCMIEVHLTDEYNELYSGEIEIGAEGGESEVKVYYTPGKHSLISEIISEVNINIKNF